MLILHLKGYPILDQLKLEEALLRLDQRNFCIFNESVSPAIVMGISGKPEELIDTHKHAQNPIPLIKRFSGGGTVVVNEETLFVSFICQKDLHPFPAYPEQIMQWSEKIYKEALQLPDFRLRENDYVLDERKVGGNAQYLCKDRWIHHTTFLWDYKKELMQLLLEPKKRPSYRDTRTHEEFITSLHPHLPSKNHFFNAIKNTLAQYYPTQETTLGELLPLLEKPHRKSTLLLDCQ